MILNELEEYMAAQEAAKALETARKLAEAEARIAELESEIEFLKKDIEAIDISDHVLGCGIEDRNITNRYEAARYGFNVAYERAMECLPV